MKRSTLLFALALSLGAGPGALSAQPALPLRAAGASGTPGAEYLLAHTGELQLTDAQVVRLAAIARRAESRRRALRTRLDSARAIATPAAAPRPVAPGDSGRRRVPLRGPARGPDGARGGRPNGPADGMLNELREQERTDLRDAIAVLTADQQATAWTMVSRMRGGPRPDGAGRTPNGRMPNGLAPNGRRSPNSPRPPGEG